MHGCPAPYYTQPGGEGPREGLCILKMAEELCHGAAHMMTSRAKRLYAALALALFSVSVKNSHEET